MKKVFGSFNNPSEALIVDVIIALNAIQCADHVTPAVKAKANGYLDSLLKFETILTAQVYLQVFSHTTPLSKYLQTVQLDLLTAQRMVDNLLENMHMLRDRFQDCYDAATTFVQWANDQLGEMNADLVMEETLPRKRQRLHKCMDGEQCIDEVVSASDPVAKYRIEVYNRIVDTIVSSIQRRFDRSASSTLYADLSLLHPRHFDQIPMASGSMEQLHKHLLRFDDDVTAEKLREELRSFREQWSTLNQSISDAYTVQDYSDSEDEPDGETSSNTCKTCKACPLCCYKVLLKLNLLTDAYKSIGLAYKLLLTLPVAQVACERSFSALKRIKTRLRSTMTQEHLEAFMLMSVEKEILTKLDTNSIIDDVAAKSSELRRLLI